MSIRPIILREKTMRHALYLLVLGVCANALINASASAQAAPEVTLTRLDCGTPNPPTEVSQRFTDIYAYAGVKLTLVYSCYLIKHGDDYMVWDSGQPTTAGPVAPKVPLPELLGKLELKPEQIKYVGISHYHGDHIGQVASLPKSTLLIGKGDWDVLVDANAAKVAGTDNANFAHWIGGGGKVEPVRLDKDVFGDGTVVMLNTPGHTPGHHGRGEVTLDRASSFRGSARATPESRLFRVSRLNPGGDTGLNEAVGTG